MTREAGTTRPLLPPWASAALTILATGVALIFIWMLAQQNRDLRAALLTGIVQPQRPAFLPRVGDTLPPLDLQDGSGRREALQELVGAGGVVAFLTTTCPYCERTLPTWTRLEEALRDEGIPFVAISLHSQERTADYAEREGIAWPMWALSEDAAASELPVTAVPVTITVSRDLAVDKVWRGVLDGSQVDAVVDAVNTSRASSLASDAQQEGGGNDAP